MGLPCGICDEFRGHNQELHNEHLEENIRALWSNIELIKNNLRQLTRMVEDSTKENSDER